MGRSLALVAAVAAVGIVRAEEPAETITVSASATVFVRPDAARIHFSVGTTELALDTAKETATKQAEATAAALKSLKLDNLTTSAGTLTYTQRSTMRAGGGFGGGPNNPGGNPAPPAVQTSFHARQPMSVTVRDTAPDKLTATVDLVLRKLIDSGAAVTIDAIDEGFGPFGNGPGGRGGGMQRMTTSSHQIEWLVTDDTAARKGAYRAAVRKAKANAEAISQEIGWNTLRIVSVVDGAAAPEPTGRAPAGEVPVTARVTLKCSR